MLQAQGPVTARTAARARGHHAAWPHPGAPGWLRNSPVQAGGAEQIVDQVLQAVRPPRSFQEAAPLPEVRWAGPPGAGWRVGLDQGQGRAQLVGDHGDEVRLSALRLPGPGAAPPAAGVEAGARWRSGRARRRPRSSSLPGGERRGHAPESQRPQRVPSETEGELQPRACRQSPRGVPVETTSRSRARSRPGGAAEPRPRPRSRLRAAPSAAGCSAGRPRPRASPAKRKDRRSCSAWRRVAPKRRALSMAIAAWLAMTAVVSTSSSVKA